MNFYKINSIFLNCYFWFLAVFREILKYTIFYIFLNYQIFTLIDLNKCFSFSSSKYDFCHFCHERLIMIQLFRLNNFINNALSFYEQFIKQEIANIYLKQKMYFLYSLYKILCLGCDIYHLQNNKFYLRLLIEFKSVL